MSDAINPKHYKDHPSGVEAIEICQYLDFALGNAVKYLWRAGKKRGQVELGSDGTVEDLSKAAWYLSRAVGQMHYIPKGTHMPITKVVDSESEGSVLRDVLELIVQKMLNGDQPRIADALSRVELEIAKRSAHA